MGAFAGPTIVTNGLTMLVDAADRLSYPGTGTVWRDLSGRGIDCTLYNSPTYASIGSLAFNGSTQYGLCSAVVPFSGSAAWTMTGWFQRTGSYSTGATWGLGTAGIATNISSYNHNNANEISIDLYGTSTFSSGQIYDLNTWNFAAWVFAGGVFSRTNVTIWKNSVSYNGTNLSVLRGGEITTPNVNPAGGIAVSRGSAADNLYYSPMTIANLTLYNRALGADEIAQNFNAYRGRYGI